MLSTRQKMAIARLLNVAIVGARTVAGRTPRVSVRRRQVAWNLDLNEGIDLAIYLGLYQRIPRRAARCIRPRALVLDIGANIGAHSLPLAREVGADGLVVAVEPGDYAFARLKANAAANPELLPRLVLIQAALTADAAAPVSEETVRFYSRWPLRGGGSDRHPRHLGAPETAGAARFLTLDTLLQELRRNNAIERPVTFIKLDVDGHELDVLRGATHTLATEKPPILIEIAPHVQDEVPPRLDDLLGVLAAHGYRLEAPDSGERLPLSAPALRALIRDGASIDALACADECA
jgi:FkbM family methyltransferase